MAAVPAKSRSVTVVALTLFVFYAGFYLCRSNFEAATPLLLLDGYDKETLGVIASAAVLVYAIGKVILGAVGDVLGGKRMMLLAAVGSIAATLAIGLTHGFAMLLTFAIVNRFFQSGAWGGLVHVASRWFPPERRGTIMGVLAMSYDAGNILTLLLCSALVEAHLGWRELFIVNPLLFAAIALFAALTLKATPPTTAVAKAAQANPAAKAVADRERFLDVLPWLMKKPTFWGAVALSFLLTFVRNGFMTWTPIYLTNVATAAGNESPISGSIAKSALFSVAGMIAAPIIGRLSDKLGPGKRAPVMVASLLILVFAVLALAHGRIQDPWVAAIAIGVCGLFLLGPYSMLAGVITLDVVGQRGTSTAVGIIDGVGYLGGSLAGILLGSVAQRKGWSAAFDVVAGAALLATLVAAGWTVLGRERTQRRAT